MNNRTIRPSTLACRGTWWGPGAPSTSRGNWGQQANAQTDNIPTDNIPTDRPSSGGGSDLRVSDSERQATADQLKAAFAAGRLDMDEYDERLQHALEAKTRGELDDLVRDLPPAYATAPKPSGGRPLFMPAFIAIAVLAAVTLAVGVTHGFFFPWWIIPIAFFVLSRHRRHHWYPSYSGRTR